MTNKRISILRSLASVGIDLSRISVKLTLYVILAALTFFFFGGFLLLNLPNAAGLVFYIVIMILVITLQIVQIVRRDREQLTTDQFQIDVEHFIKRGHK